MTDRFTPAEAAVLAPYVTNVERPIFALKNLPEEVVAVLFAYYSRSRDSLRQNLLRLLSEQDLDLDRHLAVSPRAGGDDLAAARQKAREFHEKWVVGYGHASVAEHAVAHLAVEDVSIVASKVLEDARLASFTEKSTRYVVFDGDKFYREPGIQASGHAELYDATCRQLLETYTRLMDGVTDAIRAATPRRDGQSARGHEAACRAKACDVLRYLLPAATLTNIGVTANGRALEHLICKLLSHPLLEAQAVGAALKAEAQQVIPTLIKYANPSAYRRETAEAMAGRAGSILAGRAADAPEVALVHAPEQAEDRLIAAILYGYADQPLAQIEAEIGRLSPDEKAGILDEYLKRRGPHDQPLRALEHLTFTYDVLIDFGAFRDIQRHRMATQTPQETTALHGYSTPPEIEAYGHGPAFHARMTQARTAYERIAKDFPREAQYVLPLAFRKRVLFTWNLREIHHFVQLRSGRQGHPSYRSIAHQVYRELARVHPLLAKYIRIDLEDYRLARE
jgi:thymidylate synthase ThyX